MSERFISLGPVLVAEHEDGLFRVVHFAIDEKRLVHLDQVHIVLARNVFRGDDHDVVPVVVGIETDFFDDAAGNRGSQRDAVEAMGKMDVVDVLRDAGQLVGTFFAAGALPNARHGLSYCVSESIASPKSGSTTP